MEVRTKRDSSTRMVRKKPIEQHTKRNVRQVLIDLHISLEGQLTSPKNVPSCKVRIGFVVIIIDELGAVKY